MTQSTPARPETETDVLASSSIGGRAIERRTMLRCAAACGAVIAGGGLLTACGSDDGGNTEASTPTPSERDACSRFQGGDGAGDTRVLVPTSEVPDGGGVVLAEQNVVVTQPTTGEFVAFSSTCTHQGSQVGDVADGTINCLCHGSQFSIEDGSVVTGPATAPLPAVEVTVDGDSVVRA